MLPAILPAIVDICQVSPMVLAPSPKGLDYILEQVAATPCCAPRRPMLEIRDEINKRALFYRPRCKSWACQPCAITNAKYWAFRAAYGCEVLLSKSLYLSDISDESQSMSRICPNIEAYGSLEFVTLTSHEKLSPEAALRVFKNAWDKLRKRISRLGDFEYLMVPEQHKSGKLHIHMLTTAKRTKKWWKDNARACGLGYQVAVEPIREAGKAAGYCLKYVTKSLEGQAWPKSFHRVRTSAHWPQPQMSTPLEELFSRLLPKSVQLSDQLALLQSQGYSTALLS